MPTATEQAPTEQAPNLDESTPLNESPVDSDRIASKDADGLDTPPADNPNSTGGLNKGNAIAGEEISEGCGDGSHGRDSAKNVSGAGAGAGAEEGAEKSNKDPAVGMSFPSEDQAFDFYNAFARRKGFSVRKGHLSRRKDGTVRDRHFVCSFEGRRQPHRTHVTRKPRAVERTNCLARIELKVNGESRWEIKRCVDEHNHPLASPNKTFMLRSHRKKSADHRAVLTESDYYYGVKPAPTQQLCSEVSAGATDMPVVAKEQVISFLSTQRLKDFDKGDAQFMLDFLKVKQSEDPSFVYAIQLDEKERLTNCFWTDARSVVDYSYFSDAVTLETTYRSSRFDLPFAAFLGVNHHKQVVTFGAAVLLDESVESFTWLLRTFLAAMSGQQPKTILTDLSAAISKTVASTMPSTCHRLCLWHILRIASKIVQGVVAYEQNFQNDFENLIYGSYSEDDFCREWGSLINKHGLAAVSWFSELFSARERWSLVHSSNTFYGLTATKKWNETMDNLFRFRFYRKLPLSKFMVQYFKATSNLREEELVEDHESWQNKPIPLVDIPMLAEAAKSYTRTIYADFEHEYKSQLACVCERISTNDATLRFRVSNPQTHCYGIVKFDPASAAMSCSCRKFESMGILCMHALKVLNNNNILYLPPQYIMRRWTKCAKDEQQPPGMHQPSADSEPLSSRYSRVCRKGVGLAAKSMLSKNALEHLESSLDRIMERMESFMHHNAPPSNPVGNGGSTHGMAQDQLEPNDACLDGFGFAAR